MLRCLPTDSAKLTIQCVSAPASAVGLIAASRWQRSKHKRPSFGGYGSHNPPPNCRRNPPLLSMPIQVLKTKPLTPTVFPLRRNHVHTRAPHLNKVALKEEEILGDRDGRSQYGKVSVTQASDEQDKVDFGLKRSPGLVIANKHLPLNDNREFGPANWTTQHARAKRRRGFSKDKNALSQDRVGVEVKWFNERPTVDNVSELQSKWESVPSDIRDGLWRLSMLWYLKNDVEGAPRFILATVPIHKPPAQDLRQAFDSLTQRLAGRKWKTDFKKHLPGLWEAVLLVSRHYDPESLFTRQSSVFLAHWLEHHDIASTKKVMETTGHGSETMLELSRKLAREGQHERALRTIKLVAESGMDVSKPVFRDACVDLLRRSGRDQGGYQLTSTIITTLSDLGFKFNMYIYNFLLLNSAEAGDVKTAWDLNNMIRANGITPDRYTYTILLKMCRLSNDDAAFRQLLDEIKRGMQGRLDGPVLTEILQCVHFFDPRKSFTTVLSVYEQYCDMITLQDLEIVEKGDLYHLPWMPPPPISVLQLMLQVYLQNTSSASDVARVYCRIQDLRKRWKRSIRSLMLSRRTYHIFLEAASRFDEFFEDSGRRGYDPDSQLSRISWQSIVRDMMEPLPPGSIIPETGQQLPPFTPRTQTWNIIIHTASEKGKEDEIAKVFRKMHALGVHPNRDTWRLLVDKYGGQFKTLEK